MEEVNSHTWTQQLFVDDLNNCSTDEEGTNDTDIESVGHKSDEIGVKKREKSQQSVVAMQQQQQQQQQQQHQQYQQLELQRDYRFGSHIPIEYQPHQHLHRYHCNRHQQPTNIRQPAFAFPPPYPISPTHIPYYGQYPNAQNHGMYGHPVPFMCGPRPYSWYMSPSNMGMGSR